MLLSVKLIALSAVWAGSAVAFKGDQYDAIAIAHDSEDHAEPFRELHAHGIGKYQLFDFDEQTLLDRHESHHRHRRKVGGSSTDVPPSVKVSLKAHDRALELRLHGAQKEIFHPAFEANAISSNGTTKVDLDKSIFYHGHVLDDPGSAISAYIDKTVLVGSVVTKNEHYYIERADKYFTNPKFSNIIYKGSDIVTFENEFEGKQYANLARIQKKHQDEIAKSTKLDSSDAHNRKRRVAFDPSLNTCGTYLIGDNTFYGKFGGDTAQKTRDATAEMISHLDAASLIYRITQFDPEGNGTGRSGVVQLAVKNTTVYTDTSNKFGPLMSCDGTDAACPVSEECAQPFLDTLTKVEKDATYDRYCLVHAFTKRDFCGGILGLAWVGSQGGSAGMCGKSNGDGQIKNLNTGISTTINFDVDVSKQVQTITLAHEFGHNFGSQHDKQNEQSTSGQACAPGGGAGNFIMYLRATDGDMSNNNKFSSCSIDQIEGVIKARSANCFESKNSETCGNSLLVEGICGNGILELDEECECSSTGAVDSCCDCDGDVDSETRCMIKTPGTCSPVTDPYCCTDSCTLKGKSLAETLEAYKTALNNSLTASSVPNVTRINAQLALSLTEKCPDSSVTTDGCDIQRYCINDRMYAKYKGQGYGSCPQTDHVVTLSNGDASDQDWASDVNRSTCYTYNSIEEKTAPMASQVKSCLDLVNEWNSNDASNQTQDCYLFQMNNETSCNDGANLCRYNGCSGSICSSFALEIGPDGPGTGEARKCRLGSGNSSCDVSCGFEEDPDSDKVACTSLKNFAKAYPDSNQTETVAKFVAGESSGILANGKSCSIGVDPYGGMCENGNCQAVQNDLGNTITFSAFTDWLEKNWHVVLIGIGVVILLVIALRCTYRRNKGLVDKLTKRKQVQNENANRRKKALKRAQMTNPTMMTSGMREQMRNKQKRELQMLRLKEFFPLSTEKVLKHHQTISNSEQEMVKRLLKSKQVLHIPNDPPLLPE